MRLSARARHATRRGQSSGSKSRSGGKTHQTQWSIGTLWSEVLSPFADEAPSNWAGRGDASQAAWQAAADAVVNRYIVVRSTADRKMLDDKEQAVIEAAKAWIKHIDYIGGPKRMPSEDKMLHASIKALLAAEGEE